MRTLHVRNISDQWDSQVELIQRFMVSVCFNEKKDNFNKYLFLLPTSSLNQSRGDSRPTHTTVFSQHRGLQKFKLLLPIVFCIIPS